MKKQMFWLAGVLIFLSPLAHASGIKFQHMSVKQAMEMAGEQGKLLFVDVYASWCGPCKYMSANIFTDSQVGDFYNDHFINLKLDGETPEGREIMGRYGLNAFPTLLFLDKEGKLMRKVVGAVPAASMLETGNYLVNPAASPLGRSREKFETGERDKQFLRDFIDQLAEQEEDFDFVMEAYLDAHQDISLDNENDLIIWAFGSQDLEDPLLEEFIERAVEMEQEKGELYSIKMMVMLAARDELSNEEGRREQKQAVLVKFYPGLMKIMGEECPSMEELEAELLE